MRTLTLAAAAALTIVAGAASAQTTTDSGVETGSTAGMVEEEEDGFDWGLLGLLGLVGLLGLKKKDDQHRTNSTGSGVH